MQAKRCRGLDQANDLLRMETCTIIWFAQHQVGISDVCDWAELDLNQDWYLGILNSSLFGGSILGLKALVVFMSSTNQKTFLENKNLGQ